MIPTDLKRDVRARIKEKTFPKESKIKEAHNHCHDADRSRRHAPAILPGDLLVSVLVLKLDPKHAPKALPKLV